MTTQGDDDMKQEDLTQEDLQRVVRTGARTAVLCLALSKALEAAAEQRKSDVEEMMAGYCAARLLLRLIELHLEDVGLELPNAAAVEGLHALAVRAMQRNEEAQA